jgi:hypothetical protein
MDIENLFESFPSEEELLNIIRHTSATVWDNELVEKDIESWLANFKGKVFNLKYERLLALWLLCHFTYYNKEEVKHLCRVLYRDLIHLIVHDINPSNTEINNCVNEFFEKSNIISPEETSGSGGFIAYFFRQENNLPIKGLFNFSIDNIGDNIENIIVIDDVTLTSGSDCQMHSFWEKAKKKYPSKTFYLLTLVSSEDSINYLSTKFNLKIVTTIKLDKRDKCFENESDIFYHFKDLIPIGKKFAEYYGEKIGITDSLGYRNGQYTFGFYYNTPDNSLPIFWGQRNGWIPILKRYHKNYRFKKYLQDERFI